MTTETKEEQLTRLLRRALRFVDSCPVVTPQDFADFDALHKEVDELDIKAEPSPAIANDR